MDRNSLQYALRALALTVGCFAVLTVSGCVLAVGNRGLDGTLGRQLSDLKEAHDRGALSETEYGRERKRLLDKAAE